MDKKEILQRALKTFWQSALAFVIMNFNEFIFSIKQWNSETLKNLALTIVLGATASGLSAIYNGILKPLADKLNQSNKE